MHLVDAHYHLRQDEVISIITGQFFLYIYIVMVSCFINQIIKLINKIKMEQKIKAVEKGWGEGSIFFSVDSKVAEFCRIDEIKEEAKQVSSDLMINVFRGYKEGKLVFEMGATIDVTVAFFE